MNLKLDKKIIVWLLLSINLSIAFFIGLISPLGILIIPILIILIYLMLKLSMREKNKIIIKKKIFIWILLTINLLFAFLIGATIPLMESKVKYNMGIIIIPLLIILNYIIVDRLHYFLKLANNEDFNFNQNNVNKKEKKKRPVIEFNEKKYIFTTRSIIFGFIGAPILSYLIYFFFDTQANYWLHEIVVKQTVFFLNLLFNMGAKTIYAPKGIYHWSFIIPGKGSIYFQTFCTSVQAIAVFCGIIICTPHSQDPEASEDIIWRKTKAIIISSIMFYIVNVIRMIIQIYLFYIGYAWEDIHYSISAASSFIAAIIILLLHKWIPEFIISIIYTGNLVNEKIKDNRQEMIIEMVEESNEVPLNLMRKVLRMDKQTYINDMIPWAEKFGYPIEGDLLLIPKDRVKKFIEMLAWDKPFEKEVANE